MARSKKTPCPICGKPSTISNEAFPFCSPRCKTIDLGNWASEGYVVSRPIRETDDLGELVREDPVQ